jgi:chromate reductase, NAD(P)H dehydrogenase (quinone)
MEWSEPMSVEPRAGLAVVTVCGSLGSSSANRSVLDAATAVALRHGHGVVDAGSLAAVPAFDPALADAPGPEVVALRALLGAADLALIAAPEYAGGVAGLMKNALDWMVGAGSLDRRPVAVVSCGTTGGANALAQLAQTLAWHNANLVGSLGIAAPRTKIDTDGRITHDETRAAIEHWVVGAVTAAQLHWATTDRPPTI